MAIFSKDGYSFEAPKSADEKATYSHAQNVKLNFEDGQVFTGAPEFNLECMGDSDGNYGYSMEEGVDYTTIYFDAEGNKLDKKPTSAGNYSVQFVGNDRSSWGATDRVNFTIDSSIAGAIVSSDEGGAAYSYDGKAHAPAITVTLGGYVLQEGISYSVSYVGADGELKPEKPTLPGDYTALVISEQPSTGGVLGQVKFSIKEHQLQGGTLSTANIEADANGGAVAPELTVTDSDGAVVPASAYVVSYKDANGDAVAPEDLKAAGTYTAVVTGDGAGCFGTLEAPFSIVSAGNSIDTVEQVGSLVYTGEVLVPQIKVTDKNGKDVPADNYTVTYTDKDGYLISDADLKEIGTYTATVAAVGTQYIGTASCEVTISAQAVADQVEVTLNRNTYDYQSTPVWFKDSYPSGNMRAIDRKSKAVEVDATVKLGDKVLTEGVDYVIKSTGDVTSSFEDTISHEATFVVELQGIYTGTVSSDTFKYTINNRIAKTCEYKGVKFSYAVNNDGTATITGLGVDLVGSSTQADIAAAYTTNWDGETVTIPGTVDDNGTQRNVVSVSDYAFTVPSSGDWSGSKRDIWNGAKKLVIEKNIKEIGYNAMPLSTTYCDVEELSLPEGLEVIHSWAFGASKVKNIEIPASVTAIGSAAFGDHNTGNTQLESFTFAKGSKFIDHSEGYYQSSTTGQVQKQIYRDPEEILGGLGNVEGGKEYSPISEMTIPSSFTKRDQLFLRLFNCTDYYYMGDSYPSDMLGTQVSFSGGDVKDAYRIWGWDVKDTGLLNILPKATTGKVFFRPFAVLGNSASDTYTYTEAWNPETQAADGSKDYAANTFAGTPVATNHGDEVTVDWNLNTQFVNSDHSWMPQEGTDFTVKYVKDGSTEQLDAISEPGDYTATLTGNGKTCFGKLEVAVHVDAASIEGAQVSVADEGLTYNGATQTPDVTVTLGEGDNARVLQPGTDYTVEYLNALEATDSETFATARVIGCGLYGGTADGQFSIAKKDLTITAGSATMTEGNSTPFFGWTAEGLAEGDSIVGATFDYGDDLSVGTRPVDISEAKIIGHKRLVTDSYNITYNPGTLTVKVAGAQGGDVVERFDDVQDDTAWFYDAVYYARDNGLMSGYADSNLFGPADSLTRAQAAMILWRFFDAENANAYDAASAVNTTELPDVADGAWYTGAANWAVANGVITGFVDEDGSATFAGDKNISREQLCTIVARAAAKFCDGAYSEADAAALAAMPDAAEVSDWATDAVAWSLAHEVISGVDKDGTRFVTPQDDVDRAQMAQIMMNAIEGKVLKR